MIVLPMAGRSSRFTKAGYKTPKYRLPLHGSSVLEHVINSFKNYYNTETFLFITLKSDQNKAFIQECCHTVGLSTSNYLICELDAPTSGQAETIAYGIRQQNIPLKQPLIIFNVDTFRPGFTLPEVTKDPKLQGYLEVFKGEGEGWSFVDPGPNNKAMRVTEKVRISDLCSTGLYYFKHIELFLRLFERIENTPSGELQGGEKYVAPLYNHLIKAGSDVRYEVVAIKDVIFCGVPDEYEALLNSDESIFSFSRT